MTSELLRPEAERAINRVIAARMEVFHALAALRLIRQRSVAQGAADITALIDAHRPEAP